MKISFLLFLFFHFNSIICQKKIKGKDINIRNYSTIRNDSLYIRFDLINDNKKTSDDEMKESFAVQTKHSYNNYGNKQSLKTGILTTSSPWFFQKTFNSQYCFYVLTNGYNKNTKTIKLTYYSIVIRDEITLKLKIKSN